MGKTIDELATDVLHDDWNATVSHARVKEQAREAYPLPYPRETGLLAHVDDEGRELVLHETRPGIWTAYEWTTVHGIRAALRVGLTAEQWISCARALEARR